MRSVTVVTVVCLLHIMFFEAEAEEQELEERGKKKKIALWIFIADIIIKKIFVLKLVYAFILWLVIHKAGYFLAWFVSYLKEKKEEHHETDHHYVPQHFDHHYSGAPAPDFGPYRRKSYGS